MKDYAKVIHQSPEIQTQKPPAKPKSRETIAPKKSGSGFFSVVALFILLAILFAVYRQYVRHKAATNPVPVATTSPTTTPQASNPQFDFYTVLPGGNTPGANAAAAPATTAAAAAVPSTPTATTAPVQTINTASPPASGPYYLDAGAFSNATDAQQMLSQLLLLGVDANIQTNQDNGQPSYEVVVGPFVDQDAMNIVKQQLAVHQIQASVLQQ